MQLTVPSSRCSLPLLRLIRLSARRQSHTPWPILASWVYSTSVCFTFAIYWKQKSCRRRPFPYFAPPPVPYQSLRSWQRCPLSEQSDRPHRCQQTFHTGTSKRHIFLLHKKSDKDCTENSRWPVLFTTQSLNDFDICMTVHHWYNNINNQLDATITAY